MGQITERKIRNERKKLKGGQGRKEGTRKEATEEEEGMNVSNPERKGSKTVPLVSDRKSDAKEGRELFLLPENCNIKVTPVAG